MQYFIRSWVLMGTFALADHPADIVVRGHMNREQVVNGMSRVHDKTRQCYLKALSSSPQLKGRITVHFTVAEGRTKANPCRYEMDESLTSGAFEKCVRDELCRGVFPKPKMDTDVQFPMTLTP